MRTRLLALAALLLPAAAAAQPSRDESLRAFLAAQHAALRADHPETAYRVAFADLTGDGQTEALVWYSAAPFCGSGGCEMSIYIFEAGAWRKVDELTIAAAPVRMLANRSQGWRDLVVVVRDGGMGRPYAVRARFVGGTYGITRVRGRITGRILLNNDTPSQPLFR